MRSTSRHRKSIWDVRDRDNHDRNGGLVGSVASEVFEEILEAVITSKVRGEIISDLAVAAGHREPLCAHGVVVPDPKVNPKVPTYQPPE